jgi:hypothetical protein
LIWGGSDVIFDWDVLTVPRTPLNLLAIENKQEQDEQANNSQMEDTKGESKS